MLIQVKDGVANPYSLRELKADHPNVSFPSTISDEILAQYNVYDAVETPQTHSEVTHIATMGFAHNNGQWTQIWAISARPDDEAIERSEVKLKRDVQLRLDQFARTRGYDDIFTCVGYANSTNPAFSAEATRAIELRDQTWVKFIEILDAVKAGTRRPIPASIDDIEAELPDLTWS
jgi:hypothetical protein